jgi:hypothetical protein
MATERFPPAAPVPDPGSFDALERALATEALWPEPAGLRVRILAGLPAWRERSPAAVAPFAQALARLAAAILLLFGVWTAVGGEVPALAALTPRPEAAVPLEGLLEALPASRGVATSALVPPGLDRLGASILLPAGGLLLVLGIGFACRGGGRGATCPRKVAP